MVITPKMIEEIEHTNRKVFPKELKRHLLVKYAEAPFPSEFSEQDLYAKIQNDIRNYEAENWILPLKVRPNAGWKSVGICKICILKSPVNYVILKIMLPNWNIYFRNTVWNLPGCQSVGGFNFKPYH